MKKIIVVLLIFSSYILQSQQEDNPFNETEKSFNEPKEDLNKEGDVVARGPGNPPKPLSTDDYIPLLIMTALGVIVYRAYPKKRRNILKN